MLTMVDLHSRNLRLCGTRRDIVQRLLSSDSSSSKGKLWAMYYAHVTTHSAMKPAADSSTQRWDGQSRVVGVGFPRLLMITAKGARALDRRVVSGSLT